MAGRIDVPACSVEATGSPWKTAFHSEALSTVVVFISASLGITWLEDPIEYWGPLWTI